MGPKTLIWKLDSLDSNRISKVKFSGFDTLYLYRSLQPKNLVKKNCDLVMTFVMPHLLTLAPKK